jgi:hypothetical protein
MAISLEKVVPRSVAFALVGYCVWPSLATLSSHSEAKPPEKLPELGASLLHPTLPPELTRNPLRKQVAGAAMPGAPAKPSKAAGGKAADKSKAAAAARAKPVDPLSGLRLDATCVLGNEQIAVINGRSYAVQDTLPAAEKGMPPFTIASVLPYSVLLQRDGTTIELTYSDTSSQAGPSVSGNFGGAAASSARAGSSAKSGGRPGKKK